METLRTAFKLILISLKNGMNLFNLTLSRYFHMIRFYFFWGLACLFISTRFIYAATLPIYIIEIIPHHSDEYLVNQEIQHIEKGISLGLADHLKIRQCKIPITKIIKKGSDETLAQAIEAIKEQDSRAIIIGLSRNSSARLAAKLSQGSQITGISVGSSVGHLKQINPRFFSIASPIESQWKLISQEIKSLQCKRSNTLGVFNPKNYFSLQFREHFIRDHLGEVYDLHLTQISKSASLPLEGKRCIFFGTYLSDAELIAKDIIESDWSGHLIANTDCTYFPRELHSYLLSQKEHLLKISIPTGWTKRSNPNSSHFANRFRKLANMEATPAAAYAYDAAFLAAEMACGKLNLGQTTKNELSALPLIRPYNGTTHTGHFLSDLYFLRK